MSSKKHQENVKRIIGIKDDQESLGKLDPKAPIKGRRGIAYFTSSGNLSHSSGETGAGIPVGGVSMDTYTEVSWDFDLVPVPPSTTLPPNGTPTKTVEGSCLNAQPDQNCPKLMDGATTLGGLEGLSDCTTGTPIDMNLLNDTCQPPVTKCDCVDVCVDPINITGGTGDRVFWSYEGNTCSYEATYETMIEKIDQLRGAGFYSSYRYVAQTPASGSGICQPTTTVHGKIEGYRNNTWNNPVAYDVEATSDYSFCPAEIYEEQCTEYQWDDCNCYHVEKRGGLKAGWDYYDPETGDYWYREGVNCVSQTWASQTNFTETKYHEAFYSTGYSNYSNSSRVSWNWPFTGVTPEQVFSQLPDTLTITGVSGTYNKTALFYNNPYWQASYVRPAGGTTYVYISVLSCDPEHAEYCPLGTDTFETCDTYPEKCANSETDPAAEDCNPLTLLQPQDCCAPDCDNRDWDAPDCWKEGVNCVDDPSYSAGNYLQCTVSDNRTNPKTQAYQGASKYDLYKKLPDDLEHTYFVGTICYKQPYNPTLDHVEYKNTSGTIFQNSSTISQLACGGSTEPYCNPTSTPQICDTDPICCKPDGQGGEICTQPQSCQWDSDGKVDYFFDRETGQYKVHPNDPDASLEDQQPKYPQQMNICDSFGKRIDEFKGKDNTRILVYDNAASGGIMYIIRDSDGKIISAGDSTNIDLYKDPDDPFNWG